MSSGITELKQQFTSVFGDGGKIHIIRAPGRVNLIGEHTDYNDGFVFPMAIEPHVLIACRSRDDSTVRIASTVFAGQVAQFSVDQPIKAGDPKWANYSKGVAAELIAAGIPLPGMDAMITNTLPVGGGLSSSAAIVPHARRPEDGCQSHRADLPARRARIRRRAGGHHGPDDRRVGQARPRDAARLPRSVEAVCRAERQGLARRDRQHHGEARAEQRRIRGAPQAVRRRCRVLPAGESESTSAVITW
jgi:hypothetical protein